MKRIPENIIPKNLLKWFKEEYEVGSGYSEDEKAFIKWITDILADGYVKPEDAYWFKRDVLASDVWVLRDRMHDSEASMDLYPADRKDYLYCKKVLKELESFNPKSV